MNYPCLKPHVEGVVLNLKVQPRSSKNQIVGLLDDALKIKLMSPPVDGVANKFCCEYLAKLFGLSKSRVSLISGDKSRQKTVLLRGLDLSAAENALLIHLRRS